MLAVAAGLLIVMAASRGILRSNDNGPALPEQPTGTSKSPADVSASGFAVLNGQDGAIWSGATFSEGDLMPSGQLHLTSGLAHIELFSGVQVVLEGNLNGTMDEFAIFSTAMPADEIMHWYESGNPNE